jgi:hypothetical protein
VLPHLPRHSSSKDTLQDVHRETSPALAPEPAPQAEEEAQKETSNGILEGTFPLFPPFIRENWDRYSPVFKEVLKRAKEHGNDPSAAIERRVRLEILFQTKKQVSGETTQQDNIMG